jgi:two-component system nitrogen regulation response regulator GlnG
MSPATQAKVLRLLQEQRFERLGGNETIATDVRIVAATNKDLEQAVAGGAFREDLYYRLNVLRIVLPPLRERRSDLPMLVEHFLERFKGEYGRDRASLDPDATALLERHDWPGNMRELQSVLRHALAHAAYGPIRAEHLPPALRGEPRAGTLRSGASAGPSAGVAASRVDEGVEAAIAALARRLLRDDPTEIYAKATVALDRALLTEVLSHTRGNVQRACELLGISRNTMKAKMSVCGLSVERAVLSKIDDRGLISTVR